MKRLKKWTIHALALVMLCGLLPPAARAAETEPVETRTPIKLGDYVQMGTYYGEPILWRCVTFEKIIGTDTSSNTLTDSTQTSDTYQEGYLPLLLADKIICLKAFDAAGSNTTGSHGRGSKRAVNGSNYWKDSNLRSWLNSNEQSVTWLCGNPPTADKVSDGNAYADEAGFLTNFAVNELALIQRVTQKSLLTQVDYDALPVGKKTGSGIHKCVVYSVAQEYLQNYTSAYAETVTDDMFVLDVQQLAAVQINGTAEKLGEGYYFGYPTEQCVTNSEYQDDYLKTENPQNYWLRTPCTEPVESHWLASWGDAGVRCIYNQIGTVDPLGVTYGYGVRPAFFGRADAAFDLGSGTQEDPYAMLLPHIHDMSVDCGSDDPVAFTAWTATDSLPATPGHYYLATDVTLSDTWTVPSGETNLCLNGHVLKQTATGKRVIQIASGATLNICDCNVSNSTHKFSVDSTTGLWTLSDSGDKTVTGGGVYISRGTFTLSGSPTITGNTVDGAANNVYLEDYVDGPFDPSLSPAEQAALTKNRPITIGESFAPRVPIGVSVAIAPTCGAPVNITGKNSAYWTCSVCHKLFSDAAGTTETTLEAVTIAATGHNWATEWVTTDATHHWHECQNPNCPVTDNSGKDGYHTHDYDNDQDIDCNTCGHTKTALPAAPTPTIAINYDAEKLTGFVAGAAYTINSEEVTLENLELSGAAKELTVQAGPALTVTFNTQGGSPTPDAVTGLSYEDTVIKPADPAKSGFTFMGWYTEKACVTAWDFDSGKVTADTTLYAKWVEHTYSISGTVTENGGSSAVVDANVNLMKGNQQVDSTTTSGPDGAYSFTDVAPGDYNVVATGGGKTITILVTVTDGNQAKQNLEMPTESVNSVLNVTKTDIAGAANVNGVVVDGLSAEADQVNTANPTATSVTVTMTVEGKDESAANAGDIQAAASGKTLEYLDIKVEKTVTTGSGTTTDSIPQTSRLMTIAVPFDPTGKSNITVYRYHDGKAEALPAAQPDREGFTVVGSSVRIYAQYFSTYAIGYTEAETPPAPSSSSGSTYYTITASAGEGGKLDSSGKVSVRGGSSKTFTITPDEGYVVADVLVDGESVGAVSEYTFEKVTKAHTIEASFRKADNLTDCPKDASCPAALSTDLDLELWYHDGIHFCVEHELMVGTSATTFAPEMDASRAMIATILWRLQGSPVVNYALQYDDVTDGAWYTEAVRWAASEGIVKGCGNGSFGPSDPITREQMAVMLYRYEQKYGPTVPDLLPENLGNFSDVDEIHSWGVDALKWGVEAKILYGKSAQKLVPQAPATRAEAAAMIQRFLKIHKSM